MTPLCKRSFRLATLFAESRSKNSVPLRKGDIEGTAVAVVLRERYKSFMLKDTAMAVSSTKNKYSCVPESLASLKFQ